MMAIAIAMMPHVSNFAIVKWGSMLNALRGMGVEDLPGLTDPALVDAMLREGSHVLGHQSLSQGSIITGLMWGSIVALVIDGKFRNAGLFAVVAAALSSLGILHSSSLRLPTLTEITIGYTIIGLALIFLPQFSRTERLVEKKNKREKREAMADKMLQES